MRHFPTILSLPDGTDVLIEPSSQPLTIKIYIQGELKDQNDDAKNLIRPKREAKRVY